jgi:hypothetical protein
VTSVRIGSADDYLLLTEDESDPIVGVEARHEFGHVQLRVTLRAQIVEMDKR